jgi:signal peptidase I
MPLAAIRRELCAVWRSGRRAPDRGALAEWVVTALLALFLFTHIAQPFVIPTGSMEGNLLIGDHVIVDKMAFAPQTSWSRKWMPSDTIRRGEILVFRYPEKITDMYVKRAIGLPGDRIRIENKIVYRNGKRLMEPYVQHRDPGWDSFRDEFPNGSNSPAVTARGWEMLRKHKLGKEIVVPPGMVFALGDNRDLSLDSRYWGFVPMENIVGRPVLVWWSYAATTEALSSWNLPHLIDLAGHFFTKTRWSRTFLVPRKVEAEEANLP